MSSEVTAGRVVADRYELLEVLGGRHDGTMWRARDRRLQREVAARELRLPDMLDDGEQAVVGEKVRREALAAARLNHPGVVTVFDVVDDDGAMFVVTELIEAPTLEDAVSLHGPLEPERAAAIGLELLDALAAAHAQSLMHRDVRPANVLLPSWGGARLAHFGVSALVDNPRVAASGAVPASPYLAPEQTGRAGASAASDLWSLGATLYFAVEGVPPFDGDDPATTMAAIVERPPRPASRAGALRPALEALLVKEPIVRADERGARALLRAAAGPASRRPAGPAPSSPPRPAPSPTTEMDRPDVGIGPGRRTPGLPVDDGPAPSVGDRPLAAAAAESAPAPPSPASPATPGGGDAFRPPPPHPPPPGDEQVPASAAASARPASPWTAPPVPSASESPAAAPVSGSGQLDAPVDGRSQPLPAATPVEGGQPGPAVATDGGGVQREPWFFSSIEVETVPPPPEPPPPARPAAQPTDEGRHRRFPFGIVAAVLAVLVTVLMVVLLVTGGRTHPPRPTVQKPSVAQAATNWVAYTDAQTGFTIRYPPSWTVRRSGTETDFVDPSTKTYVRVDHLQPPGPSPVDAWTAQEKTFRTRYADYRRLQLSSTTYLGLPAANWEFTYSDNGTALHALDLGFVTPKYGFALYFQSPTGEWSSYQPVFSAFKASFRPPA